VNEERKKAVAISKSLLSNLLCCCFSVATALRWLGKFLSGAARIYRRKQSP
jgi:hypothetical protein